MKDPTIIGVNTDRSNIKYMICPRITQRELSKMLADELLTERTRVVKTVLFCTTLLNCAEVYTSIKGFLGEHITEPPGKGVSTPGPTRACALVNLTCALVNS